MRFNNILVVVSFLVTLAVGLVIPPSALSSRDLEIREGLAEDDVDILAREPVRTVHRFGAGDGKAARMFS
jgi:hypothetical protein